MIPFYEYTIDENDESGFLMNSIVDVPAHMKAFITFSKDQKKEPKFFANDEEMTVMGVMISANTPIYRHEEGIGEYYGVFKKATIRMMKEKMMRQMVMHGLNTQHSNNVVKGAYMTDVFQIDEKKGINIPEPLKNQNLQDGTLIGIYKITDRKVWKDIKEGKFAGFSIEAILDLKPINIKQMNKEKKSLFERVFGTEEGQENQEAKTFAEVTTVDGLVLMYDGELNVGTALFVMDESGEQLPAPAGDYQVSVDEVTVVLSVDEQGMVADVQPVEAEEEMSSEQVLEQVEEAMKKYAEATTARFEAIEAKNAELIEENKALKAKFEKIENLKESKFSPQPKPLGKEKKSYKQLIKQ